jgi:hypothetical protein
MRYEDMVRRVCGENWKTVAKEEREGGYGVACVEAYRRGVRPTVNDLASHLAVTPEEILSAHARLLRNGVFSQRWNARKDQVLQNGVADDDGQRAWAHVAAIAGGFIGV